MTRHFPTTNTVSATTDINVLIIVGLRAASVDREIAKVAADSPADGTALTMFDSLTELPRYRESFENRRRRVLSSLRRQLQMPTRCSL